MSTLTTGSGFQQLPRRSLARDVGRRGAIPVPYAPIRYAAEPLGATAPGQSPKWAWRGAHPGAGVTTLARELGGADLGLSSMTSLPTLVVCRSSADGLIAAQRLAASELTGTPTWTCLGLVVVADGPGPLAKPLAELAALIPGGYPNHWPIPWVESWRTHPTSATGRTAPPTNRTESPCPSVILAIRPSNQQGAPMTTPTLLVTKIALLDVVNPGTGIQPPGTQGIVTVMGYVAWVVCALCVTGVLLVAGRMALHHRQGIGGEHLSGLAWVLAACISGGGWFGGSRGTDLKLHPMPHRPGLRESDSARPRLRGAPDRRRLPRRADDLGVGVPGSGWVASSGSSPTSVPRMCRGRPLFSSPAPRRHRLHSRRACPMHLRTASPGRSSTPLPCPSRTAPARRR